MLLFPVSAGLYAQNAETESSGCVDLSVTLNEVTLVDKIRWGAQAVLAPRRLDNLVPLYAYPSGDMDIREFIAALSREIEAADFRIGRAAVQNQQGHDVWRGSPLVELAGRLSDPDSLASSLNPCINAQNIDLWYVVSEPLDNYNVDPTPFWAVASELSPNDAPRQPDS